MPVSKEELLDWLADVPDDAEIGCDVGGFGQLGLLATRGSEMWVLETGDIPYPAEQAEAEAAREKMIERLREIHAQGGETEHGAMIVTLEGVVSGSPHLFSMNFKDAFTFKDREQAQAFIEEFPHVLEYALILDC